MERYSDENYISIIPTAYLTAYPRTFTDIPYSQEIFAELEHIKQQEGGQGINEEFKVQKLAPELEARYKLINLLLQKTGILQILELAAGLSTRGLSMVNNPNVKYVELDLKPMADIKTKIIDKLIDLPSNLHILDGNALRFSDLKKTIKYFDQNKQICIVNEGLLRYLNFSEKEQVAHNVYKLLEQFGGVWITSDVTLKKLLETQNAITMPGKNKIISVSTGKNFNDNSFENEEQAIRFFENQGFVVEIHQFSEVADLLVSPQKLAISEDEVKKINHSGRVLVMRVAKKILKQ